MAITRPEHLGWCEVFYDVLEGKIHIVITHDGATRRVEYADHINPQNLMRQVFKVKNELMQAERVARALA